MKKDTNKNFWKSLIEKSSKLEIETANLEIVNKETFKQLRESLKFSQSKMANIIGVSKKTIEKWEQGANPIQGAAARLIYLIIDDNSIIERLYSRKLIKNNKVVWTDKAEKTKFKTKEINLNHVYILEPNYYANKDENQNLTVRENLTWQTKDQYQPLPS